MKCPGGGGTPRGAALTFTRKVQAMASIPRQQLLLPFSADDDVSPDAVVCRTCNVPQSPDEFYIKDKKTGRRATKCKKCTIAYVADWQKAEYAKDPEKARAVYRARAAHWREANPEKSNEISRRSNKKNRPKLRESERAYRAANHEKIREKKKRYKKRHKDVVNAGHARYREANHERLRERHKQWRDAHIERLREIVSDAKHRRRARLAGSGGSHTAAEWNGLKEFYDYTCLLCNRREPEIKLTRDHYIPISRGGTNDIDNIIPLCKSCNSRKHAKLIKIELLHVQTPDESL
jgi:5-methylcytosine-specific restriction endonuclease McrA